MKKIKYQLVKVDLLANISKRVSISSDMLFEKITGIAVVSTDAPTAFSTLGVSIASSEIFPEDFSTLFLDVKNDFLIGDRFFDLSSQDLPAKGSTIEFIAKSNLAKSLWIYLRLGNNYSK